MFVDHKLVLLVFKIMKILRENRNYIPMTSLHKHTPTPHTPYNAEILCST